MNGCTVNTLCGKEVEWDQEHVGDATVSGVFSPLINHAAFVDKLVVGIKGKLRKRLPKTIDKTANPAIGGPGRPYARSMHGIYRPTGNPFEVKYGPNPRYSNLFDAKLTMRSERAPLSLQEVTDLITCLVRKGNRSVLNGMEFTCDVSVPVRFFENHILARVRSIRTLVDDCGRQTLYAGVPAARWMLRVYEKTKSITRVEFVLRRAFLARAGINDLASVGALKDVQWNRLVKFPAVCQRALEDLIEGKVAGKQSQIILEWPGRRPTVILMAILKEYGIAGDQILKASPAGEMLLKMRKSFSWANTTVGCPKQ